MILMIIVFQFSNEWKYIKQEEAKQLNRWDIWIRITKDSVRLRTYDTFPFDYRCLSSFFFLLLHAWIGLVLFRKDSSRSEKVNDLTCQRLDALDQNRWPFRLSSCLWDQVQLKFKFMHQKQHHEQNVRRYDKCYAKDFNQAHSNTSVASCFIEFDRISIFPLQSIKQMYRLREARNASVFCFRITKFFYFKTSLSCH